jgi:DNA uptake protein ComE-like DNA-binding protein
LEYRRNNGGFQNLADLMKFEEIDSIRFERIALYLQLDNKNP